MKKRHLVILIHLIALVIIFFYSCVKKNKQQFNIRIEIESTTEITDLQARGSNNCIPFTSETSVSISEVNSGYYEITLDDSFSDYACIQISGMFSGNPDFTGETVVKLKAINLKTEKIVGKTTVVRQHPFSSGSIAYSFNPRTYLE